ncbi:MAG TPA: glycoside hydrolase family 2 TIM barrel-domain containing protein [Acidobacteriaceae bacterium]|nr:glycoside hydrolase family 2 TIM barrel-domain containing protein [Acidobacteriaceae bacterium]
MNANWKFRTDPANVGEAQGWSQNIPDETETVSVPNTWNIGKYSRYEGTAWYFKTFPADPSLRGRHVELHFGATFYKAHVWLNGVSLGEHEGGYTEYYFDVSSHLQPINTIAVEINNQPKVDTIPGAPLKSGPGSRIYDWWPYGGIVRDVWLTVNDQSLVRWQHIDSTVSGSQAQVSAQISDRVAIENYSRKKEELKIHLAVYSQTGGTPIASATQTIAVTPGRQEVVVPLTIQNPHLWDFDNPYLYSVVCDLTRDNGDFLDSIHDNIGIRTIQIKDRHLYLNGQRVRLTGLTRHEDSPWEGLAETRGTMLHDYDDLKNLQTTLTRPVHYPQNPFIYNYADRNGILMIPEIPMWQFSEQQMTNPRVIALAKRMFTEMVEQNYNHPSIFAWSTDNESATDTPGGIAYFKTMYALAKKLNPQRFVSFADDRIAFVHDPSTNASSLADFVMWNEYFGTWDAPASQLPAAINRIGKDYPDKMFIISEFGTPGIYATNAQTADQLRVQTIRKQLALFAKQDWIAGAILWCYQDYASYHNLRPGQPDHYVDHGVVDQNRQRKPSYYVWRQENEPAHIHLHWTLDSNGIPAGFSADIARRSIQEIPSYPLVHYRAQWMVYSADGKEIATGDQPVTSMETAQTILGKWTVKDPTYLHLELRLYRPTGFLAQTGELVWRYPELGGFDGATPPQ